MIKIIVFGKIKETYLKDMCDDYLVRLRKYHKIELIVLNDELDQKKELISINKVFNSSDYNICTDIVGKRYDSISFSNHVDKLFNYNSTITFIIGSSFGVPDEIKQKCNEKISFSDFTFPHGMFRAILLEQIYRSFKIKNNEAYHK